MKQVTLNLFFLYLGLISTCALAAEPARISGTEELRKALQSSLIENLPIADSPFSLTFKNGEIAIYEGEKLFNKYDTNIPRLYVMGMPLLEEWNLINVLFEPSSQAVYVHARLPMYEWPLLKITQNSVTELYRGEGYTIWSVFKKTDGYVYVNRARWASNENDETIRIAPEDSVPS